MDRHNIVHQASRVELAEVLNGPGSAIGPEVEAMSESGPLFPGTVRSRRADMLGKFGLWTCSLAVIATATLLAVWVA